MAKSLARSLRAAAWLQVGWSLGFHGVVLVVLLKRFDNMFIVFFGAFFEGFHFFKTGISLGLGLECFFVLPIIGYSNPPPQKKGPLERPLWRKKEVLQGQI